MSVVWEVAGPRPQVQRHSSIGGTELCVLMGIPSFGATPQNVYDRIVNSISTFTGNVYSDRGVKYEPVVRAAFTEATGASLLEHPGIIRFECFAASLDDIAQRDGASFPVDYKTASVNSIKKWAKGPPENYRVQLVMYMAALEFLGIPCAHAELYAAFGVDEKNAEGKFTGQFLISEYRHFIIQRDRDFEQHALDCGRKFWREHVMPKIPPNPSPRSEPMELNPDEMALYTELYEGEPAAILPPDAPPPDRTDPNHALADPAGKVTVTVPRGVLHQKMETVGKVTSKGAEVIAVTDTQVTLSAPAAEAKTLIELSTAVPLPVTAPPPPPPPSDESKKKGPGRPRKVQMEDKSTVPDEVLKAQRATAETATTPTQVKMVFDTLIVSDMELTTARICHRMSTPNGSEVTVELSATVRGETGLELLSKAVAAQLNKELAPYLE